MSTSPQSFVSKMVLNALILVFLPLIASQCMDYKGIGDCAPTFNDSAVSKDLLECMNDCLAKPDTVCRLIQWKPRTKQCHVDTTSADYHSGDPCITFKKTPCNNIPDDGSLQIDTGSILMGGRLMTFVTSLEECKTICAIDSTCLAFTWLSKRRRCIIQHRSVDRSIERLGQGDYQVIKKGLRPKGRCVVLNAGGNSPNGIKDQNANSLMRCVENVLNKSSNTRVDWNTGNGDCWAHDSIGGTTFSNPAEDLIQLQKHQGCKLWQGAVSITKIENTKMSGGLNLKGLSEKECVEFCQLVSNCAAAGWSGTLRECTFHHLELSTAEEPSNTLYTIGGVGITTSTTTVSTSTASPTISTSTDATTAAPTDVTGTVQGAFFIRRDNNQLTSKSQRRASLECAMLCFRSNCSDFTLTILNNDSVCGMSGSQTPGRSPKTLFEWIKL